MRNKRISIKKVIFYICLLGLIILLVMPILWAMLLSLKTNNEIVNSPLSLPQTISFENYQRAIDTIDFSRMYFNTILLVVISTFFSILFTFMSSFAIARMVFRNHKASETLYLFLLVGIGIPIYVLLFPVYPIDSLMGIFGTDPAVCCSEHLVQYLTVYRIFERYPRRIGRSSNYRRLQSF